MTLDEAKLLIENEHLIRQNGPQVWADLGCGSGLFTRALGHFLEPGSAIHAVDKGGVPPSTIWHTDVRITGHVMDFEKERLPVVSLDGILMANALHYVQNPAVFLAQCYHLYANPVFLFVEYDTEVAVHPWVPYPVSFDALRAHCRTAGYAHIEQGHTRASAFGHARLYTAYAYR